MALLPCIPDFTAHYSTSILFYLTVLLSTIDLLDFTTLYDLLHSTVALLDSTAVYNPSIIFYMILLHSTIALFGSTLFHLTLYILP